MLPWYARVLAGKLDHVQLCYLDNNREIVIADGTRTSRRAFSERKDVLTGETLYCAAFNAEETQAAKETLVSPADGWIALFR